MKLQTVYDDGVLQVLQTPKGPQIYLGTTRIHHWMPGIMLGGLGLLGLLLDDKKQNRPRYVLISLIGALLVLDDFLDFLSFLEGST